MQININRERQGKVEIRSFQSQGHINGNKLRTYRLYKSDLQTETYVKLPLQRDHRRILSMFRLVICFYILKQGVLLNLKFQSTKELVFIAQRALNMKCFFLMECHFYDDIRRKMLHKAQLCNTDFFSYTSTEKLIFFDESWKHAAYCCQYITEPCHEKTCFSHKRKTKAQISQRIRAVLSAPLLFIRNNWTRVVIDYSFPVISVSFR